MAYGLTRVTRHWMSGEYDNVYDAKTGERVTLKRSLDSGLFAFDDVPTTTELEKAIKP